MVDTGNRLFRACVFAWILIIAAFSGTMSVAFAAPSYVLFESGPVRPMASNSDGSRLYVTNIPDGRLEVFAVTDAGITMTHSVPVGVGPVAVSLRNDNEAWVVNHLSDSISIVNLAAKPPRVVRTLLVGDEPRDIVFAGTKRDLAFVTTAHRGQRLSAPELAGLPGAGDPKLTEPGIGRADVWIFDAASLGRVMGGRPVKILNLFGDTPRALAVSPDRSTVYAAIFHSGNQTTAVNEGVVCDHEQMSCVIKGVEYPGPTPKPHFNVHGDRAPKTSIIVKFDRTLSKWIDTEGRDWSDAVKFSLPDHDVFAINANTQRVQRTVNHVGSTLFNMATNPINGDLYISGFRANNTTRFEGSGISGGSTVQGRLAEARVAILQTNGNVQSRRLNSHIDYSVTPAPQGTSEHSLSTPLQMIISADGSTLYVAAFGSQKIGVIDTAALIDGAFNPRTASQRYIQLQGGGPSGLVLDERRRRLYVMTRFDNSVSVIDIDSSTTISHVAMPTPEPADIVDGRKFLYDANLTSSNGEAACASCHVFGDLDHLAWDLGNPDEDVTKNPLPMNLQIGADNFDNINGTNDARDFHPMKGPMATQTLKGLKNSGHMHWRADRVTGFFGEETRTAPPFDSDLSFRNFITAFTELNGAAVNISASDMQKFSDFALQMQLPPNPVRNLDNSLTRAQKRGRKFYFGCEGGNVFEFIVCDDNDQPVLGTPHRSDGVPALPDLGFACNECHTLDPAQGFFGTDGTTSFEDLNQIAKIPHIRNVYTKIGMFGNPAMNKFKVGDNEFQGRQVRGFGVLHDGSVDSVFRFMRADVFDEAFEGFVGFAGGDPQRRDIEAFMHAFPTDLPPITGQQITLSVRSGADVHRRIDLLVAQAKAGFESKLLGEGAKQCELVASFVLVGRQRMFLFDPSINAFRQDTANGKNIPEQNMRLLAREPGREVTYTCVPYGSGVRTALDRDQDGILNADDQ